MTSPRKEPKVTIVTLNYNGVDLLDKHYRSLLNQSYAAFETILVDNGSTDSSIEFVKKNFPGVKVKKIENNVGPVRGYMTGAKAIADSSKYIVICGNDTWFDRDWLKEMVTVVESSSKIAVCGGVQKNYKGDTFTNVHGMGVDIFGYSAGIEDCFYINGVSLMVKRDVFFKIGGFDERFWMYVEEVDLAWRARLMGYRIAKAYKAILYHWGGATIENRSPEGKKAKGAETTLQKRYLVERNTLCMLLKNYSFFSLLYILPLFFLLNFLETFVLFVLRRPRFFAIYLRAWFWNLQNIRETLRLRRKIQATRKVSDREMRTAMSFKWAKLGDVRKLGFPIIKN